MFGIFKPALVFFLPLEVSGTVSVFPVLVGSLRCVISFSALN